MLHFWIDLQNHISGDEEGAGMVEYSLLIAMVGILLIGALLAFKDAIAGSIADAPSWFDSTA